MNTNNNRNRTPILIFLISSILFTISLISCTGKSAEKLLEQEIVSNTISAMDKITTYKLNMDLIFTNTIPGETNSQTYSNRWQWQSQRQFDLVKNEMQMSMYSGDPTNSEITPDVWDSYVIDGWEYLKGISPPILPTGSEAWFKTKLSDNNSLFSDEAQISPLAELLNTAAKVSLIGSENVDGTDCYILHITPSKEGIGNWVVSQQQPSGLSFLQHGTSSVEAAKEYAEGYQESWIIIWVEKGSCLIKNTEINVLFSLNSTSISYFQGQMNFYDYNTQISIKVPAEGLDAPSR
jgi:hypothetical protein